MIIRGFRIERTLARKSGSIWLPLISIHCFITSARSCHFPSNFVTCQPRTQPAHLREYGCMNFVRPFSLHKPYRQTFSKLILLHTFLDQLVYNLFSMERQQLKSENDFGVSFSLESSEAKKIIAKNYREEKRLEKVHKSLEKQQTADEKKRLKAQKQSLINFLKLCARGRNSSRKIWFQDQMTASTGMSSPDQLSSRSAVTWEPQTLEAIRNNSARQKERHSRSQKSGFDYSQDESASFFSFPDMKRILAINEEYFIRRSQSWCSETAQHKVCLPSKLVGKNGMKLGNSTQRNFIREEVQVKSERQGKERNLCDVLPPVVLPPLYSQKNKTLREKRLATLKRKDQEALWEGLEDCRYIRTYFKENWVRTVYSFNLLFIRESCKIR